MLIYNLERRDISSAMNIMDLNSPQAKGRWQDVYLGYVDALGLPLLSLMYGFKIILRDKKCECKISAMPFTLTPNISMYSTIESQCI